MVVLVVADAGWQAVAMGAATWEELADRHKTVYEMAEVLRAHWLPQLMAAAACVQCCVD